MKYNQMTTIIGATIFLALIGLFMGIFWLGQYRHAQQGYTIHILFKDVSGLNRDDPVQMQGVQIGQVEQIRLKNNQVIVSLRIDKGYLLQQDCRFVIENIGFLGEKAVKIYSGNSLTYLAPGDTTQGIIEFGLEDLGKMALQLQTKTENILTDKNLQNLSIILADLTKTTNQMKKIFNHRGNDMGAIINNVKKGSDISTQMLAENRKNINELTLNLKTSSAKLDTVTERLDKITVNLKEITQKIKQGKGTMGKFIYDDTLYQKLLSAACKIDSLADDIKKKPQRYLKISLF